MKTAIVTGGSGGIGAAICRAMIADGYEVISVAHQPPDWQHERLRVALVDLLDPVTTAAMAADLAARFEVSHLIHNAGVIRPDLLADVKLGDLHALTQLHLGAPLQLLQAVLPGMRRRGFGRHKDVSRDDSRRQRTRAQARGQHSGASARAAGGCRARGDVLRRRGCGVRHGADAVRVRWRESRRSFNLTFS